MAQEHYDRFRQLQHQTISLMSRLHHTMLQPMQRLNMARAILSRAIERNSKTETKLAMDEIDGIIMELSRQIRSGLYIIDAFRQFEPDSGGFHSVQPLHKLALERIDLAALIEQLHSRLCRLFGVESIKLERPILTDSCEPVIYGYLPEIRDLFECLLTNALKYSEPETFVRTRYNEIMGERLEVFIENYGIGIGKTGANRDEERSHIFELGFRCQEAKSRDIAGVGIGLWIARYIMKRHGGEIELNESTPVATRSGKVCFRNTFRLSFPKGRCHE